MQKSALKVSVSAEQLLEQYQITGAPHLRDQIVEMHLYVASIIARRFSGRGVDYDDLFQVASLALFKAIDRYDASKGIKFMSFAMPSMVGEVKNYFRDRSRVIRLPRRGGQLLQLIQKARAELEQELHRSPTVDELAAHIGVSEEDILEGLELSGAVSISSLDAHIAEDEDDAPLSKFLGAEDSGFGDFERKDMLARAMRKLDERQQQVIQLRFFENLSQRDVAERLGTSQMTVSRVERQALAVLREHVNMEDDQENNT